MLVFGLIFVVVVFLGCFCVGVVVVIVVVDVVILGECKNFWVLRYRVFELSG